MNKQETAVKIFGCGGCGITWADMVSKQAQQVGRAVPEIIYVDTSKSNLDDKNVVDAKTFLLSDVDGSGKVRRDNSEAIMQKVGDLLMQHQPADLNIVLFSAGGGSGSVFGPLLVRELLLRDKPVVAFVVGTTENAITATNTLNTLKSLDLIAREQTKAPVVMHYSQNPTDKPSSSVDLSVVAAIELLLVFGSKQNVGLDTRDLRNMLRYDHATKVPSQLSLLEITTANTVEEIKNMGVDHVISVGSIYRTPENALPLPVMSEYGCVGYLPTTASVDIPSEFHLLIHTDEVREIVNAIQVKVNQYEEFNRARAEANKVATSSDVVDSGSKLIL